MQSVEVTIEDLFEFLNINNDKYYESQLTDKQFYVKSDNNELAPILSYLKKPNMDIYKCVTESGKSHSVADTHMFRYNGKPIYAKDCLGVKIDTLDGDGIAIVDVIKESKADVYDISIENPHWYCHNENEDGIISHNTAHMASWAAYSSINGFNVAIFSMEDGEIGYGSRLDANLMSTTLAHMKTSGMAMMTQFQSIINENMGQIKIKEFPTGGANVNHLRATLLDWKTKDGFVPDIIFVDYINIMASSRKVGGNGYENGKMVAEELRGLAVELECSVVSATQGRRDVFAAQTLSMADVAESIGIPQTADVMIGIVSGGEEQPDKHFLSVLKSRQINKSKLKPCAVNVSTEHQRIWDVDDKRRFKPNHDIKQTFAGMETFVAASEIMDTVPESKQAAMPTSIPVGRNADLASLFKGF